MYTIWDLSLHHLNFFVVPIDAEQHTLFASVFNTVMFEMSRLES